MCAVVSASIPPLLYFAAVHGALVHIGHSYSDRPAGTRPVWVLLDVLFLRFAGGVGMMFVVSVRPSRTGAAVLQ